MTAEQKAQEYWERRHITTRIPGVFSAEPAQVVDLDSRRAKKMLVSDDIHKRYPNGIDDLVQ